MRTHLFAKEAPTLHLARSEGHEHYFGCNLMHCKVLVLFYQHLMAEAPVVVIGVTGEEKRFKVKTKHFNRIH